MNYNLLNDPLAERIRIRTERAHEASEQKRSIREGLYAGSRGNGPYGVVGLLVVGVFYVFYIVVEVFISESYRTLRKKLRPKKKKKRRKVRTIINEV
ncbi:MAG TPA: hypothetical protein EYN96_02210 [Candidatus Hydrogenedentes bacterium]|nr:hypothetical protein [Candidatus Hydrogenedentota bacterium]